MDSTVIERVKEIRKNNKVSQKEFALALGVSAPYIAGLEMGRNSVNQKFLNALKEKYNISADWLLFGEKAAINLEDSLKMALILDTADRETLIASWTIYELLRNSSYPDQRKAAQAIKDANFEDQHKTAWNLGEQKSELYRIILKHLHLENKPISELTGTIQAYLEISIKMHNYISEMIDSNHEHFHGHGSFSYR
ncbi:helix-turn-helix domain-containing protein [Marinifilum sp.]|uniref:helix-turn-helix domain-containing protein n=1 Tax=Marinifilum sp. TaxID=2033137 RepID=UPI003BAA88BC